MADANIPYSEAGQAAFEELDTWSADLLISGSWPKLSPGRPYTVKADEVLEQFEVVGLDGNGDLVPAVLGTTEAIGVLTQAVTGNAGGTTTVPVFIAGCFNPDILVWDATYDTPAKKAAAFDGAPSPTQILIKERHTS